MVLVCHVRLLLYLCTINESCGAVRGLSEHMNTSTKNRPHGSMRCAAQAATFYDKTVTLILFIFMKQNIIALLLLLFCLISIVG